MGAKSCVVLRRMQREWSGRQTSFISNGISFVVRVRPFFRTALQIHTVQYILTTVLLYMCSKQNIRRTTGTRRGTHHGQYKGTHPRVSRPCTEVLRTRTYSSAANILLRSRASRGHLNLWHFKSSPSGSVSKIAFWRHKGHHAEPMNFCRI